MPVLGFETVSGCPSRFKAGELLNFVPYYAYFTDSRHLCLMCEIHGHWLNFRFMYHGMHVLLVPV